MWVDHLMTQDHDGAQLGISSSGVGDVNPDNLTRRERFCHYSRPLGDGPFANHSEGAGDLSAAFVRTSKVGNAWTARRGASASSPSSGLCPVDQGQESRNFCASSSNFKRTFFKEFRNDLTPLSPIHSL